MCVLKMAVIKAGQARMGTKAFSVIFTSEIKAKLSQQLSELINFNYTFKMYNKQHTTTTAMSTEREREYFVYVFCKAYL